MAIIKNNEINQTLRSERLVSAISRRYFPKERPTIEKSPPLTARLLLSTHRPFIAKAPHDVITGQPLKYRRTDDGLYVLYSVGWDGNDNGGIPTPKKHPDTDLTPTPPGDWPWRFK